MSPAEILFGIALAMVAVVGLLAFVVRLMAEIHKLREGSR